MILLVIDMQKGIVDEELYAYDTFIERTVRLIEAARKNNVEVVYVRHDAGSGSGMSVGDEDFEIADQVRPEQGEKVFVKTINSCFGNKEFKEYTFDIKDFCLVCGLDDKGNYGDLKDQIKKIADKYGR